jgi:hypothetical protein
MYWARGAEWVAGRCGERRVDAEEEDVGSDGEMEDV